MQTKNIMIEKGQFLKTSESETWNTEYCRRPVNDYKAVEGDDGWKVQRQENMPTPFLTHLSSAKKTCSAVALEVVD